MLHIQIHFQPISVGQPGRITGILTKNGPRKDDPKRTWWWSSLDAKWKDPLYLSLRISTKVGLIYTFCIWIYQFYSRIVRGAFTNYVQIGVCKWSAKAYFSAQKTGALKINVNVVVGL